MKFADYQPVGATLFHHQRETIAFILKNIRCFVFDDMGTGKTLSSLCACDFLFLHRKIKRVLIVSPLSVVRSGWVKEIMKRVPGRSFTVLEGTRAQRIANLNLDCDFYIINTDGVRILGEYLLKRGFDVLIVDESTSFANFNSKRTQNLIAISMVTKGVICLSGDPIADDVMQSFSQARIIHPNKPRYFTKYRALLKTKVENTKFAWEDKPDAIKIAYSYMQPNIRHVLEDCYDLPDMVEQKRIIPMSNDQITHYTLMEKELVALLETPGGVTPIIAKNAAIRYMKLLQISCGVLIDNESNAYRIDCGPRIEELLAIKKNTKKLIVFGNFTESIDAIHDALPGSEVIDGRCSDGRERARIIDAFQDGNLETLVCHPGAISHGVTLTASRTIVWFSPCFSNEKFTQCNRRIRRIGQKRAQLVIKFQSSRAESRVYSSLKRKQKVSSTFLSYCENDGIIEDDD